MQVGIGAVVAADDQVALGTAARPGQDHLGGDQRTRSEATAPTATAGSSPSSPPRAASARPRWRSTWASRSPWPAPDVCVVDLDLAFGDVAITMQLIPEHTIAEAADSEHDLDFSMLQTLLTRHPSGLTILAAPTHPEGRDRISASLVRRVIQTLRHNFDYLVIDTPPGFDDQVLGAFDETDECIIVATLDVPTIKNTKVAIETLDLLHLVPNNRHLVLNRADEEVGLSQANVEEILGHEDLGRPPQRDRGGQRHQPRSADRPVQAGPPGLEGHHRPRPARSSASSSAPSRVSPPSAACSGARRSARRYR